MVLMIFYLTKMYGLGTVTFPYFFLRVGRRYCRLYIFLI